MSIKLLTFQRWVHHVEILRDTTGASLLIMVEMCVTPFVSTTWILHVDLGLPANNGHLIKRVWG